MVTVGELLQAARDYRRAGRLAEAEILYRRALALDSAQAACHFELGDLYRALGRAADAEESYRQSIGLDPDFPSALNNLGTLLLLRDSLDEARRLLERAVKLRPDYALAHNNLGSVWLRAGQFGAARECFSQALLIQPDFGVACYNLGTALHREGRLSEAEDCLRRALKLVPEYTPAHYQLGVVLKDRHQLAEAHRHLSHATRLDPGYAEAWSVLAAVSALQGDSSAAQRMMDRALEIQPSDANKLRAVLLLPAVYESLDHLKRERLRLRKRLARLSTETLAINDPATAVGMTPFYLAYQGKNDRRLAARLASLYCKACPELLYEAPHCRTLAHSRYAQRPLRVGFLSAFFYRHSIGKLNLGYIANLDRTRFTVVLLRFPGPDDPLARALERAADSVVTLPRTYDAARREIAGQELDVLYYPDIGMDPLTYFLAFARLAPVQCAAWGHPVTTGIPTIDHFLSSNLLEPEDCPDHYSEELVRFHRINCYYYEPAIAEPLKPRAALGLPEDGHLYVCTQSLFKIHPRFDALLGAILRNDPRGRVVLIEGVCAEWKDILLARFGRAFPEGAARVVFVPRLTQDDFLHLQARADVLLDTTYFGGGNTSYEAFAAGTPVVTRCGRALRDRITAACYRQMGLPELIANTDAEYVRRAVDLGTAPAERDRVRAQILACKHRLFEDVETVRELEEFLVRAAQRCRARGQS